MSLNSVMLQQDTRHPVPLPNENFLYHCSGVKFELTHTNRGNYPGGGLSPECSSGTAFISNQRIVYLPKNTTHHNSTDNSSRPGALNSFTVPHANLHEIRFAQPVFGANRFEAVVEPVRGGGVAPGSLLVLSFKEGGGFDFVSIARKIGERTRETGEVPLYEESLPEYDDPPNAHSAGSSAMPPAYSSDAPPSYQQ
ncbi:hypothetical protein LPJ64_005094 [Coemansia asiatica]|uniref:Uncharacterized protein n=1 Tax=Coemansia asiatica TaxID=1052880 RepID=A0A9W7XF15_9FUNG|nr:hypothetical protein LPJ64_005094 [Coemansia asiatica]KAJ2888135.1 hypothetical protein FB639_000848 [Coemansia asiatica]